MKAACRKRFGRLSPPDPDPRAGNDYLVHWGVSGHGGRVSEMATVFWKIIRSSVNVMVLFKVCIRELNKLSIVINCISVYFCNFIDI